MDYTIHFKPRAEEDLAALPRDIAARILRKIARLGANLAGDVKRLTNYFPGYRLRVGDYRVLFHVEGLRVVVYRVLNRRDAYE